MAFDRRGDALRVKSGIADTGLTISQFAEVHGLKPDTVSAWASGRSGFTLENAVRLCDALGKPLDWLACRGRYSR